MEEKSNFDLRLWGNEILPWTLERNCDVGKHDGDVESVLDTALVAEAAAGTEDGVISLRRLCRNLKIWKQADGKQVKSGGRTT